MERNRDELNGTIQGMRSAYSKLRNARERLDCKLVQKWLAFEDEMIKLVEERKLFFLYHFRVSLLLSHFDDDVLPANLF